MLQFFLEMIIAVLAVYGAYTALHEMGALICKWIDAPRNKGGSDRSHQGKEDSEDGRKQGSDHPGGDG